MTTNNTSYTNIIYPAYRIFMDHHIELVYHGDISSSTADALINIFEHLLYNKDAPVKIQKRAFYILVEALQNVIRHQAVTEKTLSGSSASLLFQYINGHFIFTLKNLVENENIKTISRKIDALNALGKSELNKHYKKILKNEVLSDKGGAGLGLIEIARKSENIISYEFLKADETYSWFFFNIMVADRGKEKEMPTGEGIPVAKELHRLLDGSRLWFVLREEYPAMFPSGMTEYVAATMNCKEKSSIREKFLSLLKIFYALCSAVSLIQRSTGKKPCLIYFTRGDQDLSIFTGMPVSVETSDKVLTFFNSLFSGKPEISSLIINNEPDRETLKKLAQLPTYLPRPPRIIFQELSPAEKFILLKFTF